MSMSGNIEKDTELGKFIVKKGPRVFIDISSSGCGNGCSYCYVSSREEPQKLLDFHQIKNICELIASESNCASSIISLCPNSEPLKSTDSIERVLYIIRFFLQQGAFIQISTKELIPDYFLRSINEIAKKRLFINISIPFIRNADTIEPGAATIEDRTHNFANLVRYENLIPCLYIKPFSSTIAEYADDYINLINNYNIKYVCVGVNFRQNETVPCQSLYCSRVAKELFEKQSYGINNFIRIIRSNTTAKVFGSSVCCICNTQNTKCLIDLGKYNKFICEDCIYK